MTATAPRNVARRVSRRRLVLLAVVTLLPVGAVVSAGDAPTSDKPPADPRPAAGDDAWIFAPSPQADAFPLDVADRRVHVFETRHRGLPTGVLVYEVAVSGTEPLADGFDYVVRSTWTRPRFAFKRKLVSREWLRRDASGVLCGRRQEGVLTADLVPAQLVLPSPLVAGRTWTWVGTSDGLPCRLTGSVLPPERVVASRGTFDGAWQIDTEATGARGDRVRRSAWLKPGVGLVQERSTVVAARRTLQLDAALLSVRAPFEANDLR